MELMSWERRWLCAAQEAFSPPSSTAVAPKPGEVDAVTCFEVANAHANPLAKLGLHVAIHLVGTAPFWARARLATLDGLPLAERTRLLESLLAHRSALVRDMTWLLKVQASLALLGTQRIRRASAYDRERDAGTPVHLRRARREVA